MQRCQVSAVLWAELPLRLGGHGHGQGRGRVWFEGSHVMGESVRNEEHLHDCHKN